MECGNDELLLKSLGVTKTLRLHEANRDEVVKYILKKDPHTCIGLIDEDPGTPRGIQRSQFNAERAATDLHVEIFGERRLVVLHPFLEGWLIKAVKACGGSIAKLDKGLSDDPRELHRLLTPRGDKRLVGIVDFLKAKDSRHLKALKAALGI